ncbi:TlpA disulfide reductase family protein [Tsukamurella tyrosinosolvens]|uniref:TlpA disulfide reductase family protein n=1 Tax=Tsukamurella tyrosinosolvens TaxID=57704 RepID=UPI0009EF2092|nr:TlpA disulfide reductase family protein [Tsukamurella tyrosinosolvens]
MPSTRASRRICANSSTFDPIIGHHLLRLGNDVHEQPSGGARSNRRNTTGESQTGPGLAVEPGPLQAVIASKARHFYPPERRSVVGELSGRSVTDPGATLRLSDYAGKVVVINVWGSWCAPCRLEAPALEKVYTARKSKGVQFLGIDVRETAGDDAARDFIRSHGLTYPSIYDPPGKTLLALGEQYPTTVVPMTFVLDRQHRVAAAYLTTIDEKTLTDAVDRVAGEG